MAGFHVRAARAVAQIIYAVRAQVLNQLVCSDHVRVFVVNTGLLFRLLACGIAAKAPKVHPNYDIF
jgi:hypothetical protein